MDELAIGRRQRFAGIALIGAVMFTVAAVVAADFRTDTWNLAPVALLMAPVIIVLAPLVIRRGGGRVIQALLIATILAALSNLLAVVLVTLDPTAADASYRTWWVGVTAVYGFGLMSAPWSAWRQGAWR